jgi:hypothetical protein
LLDGTLSDVTPLERALIGVVRKAWAEPARLTPSDLGPVRSCAGDGALDYALVIGAFHFVNRIADLLHVDPEFMPQPLRRLEPLRRLMVRVASLVMRRMDLAIRPYRNTYEEALARLTPLLERTTGRGPGDELLGLRARPKLIEAMALALEERERSTLDRATLMRIQRTVEEALPTRVAEAEGFHTRPADPVEAFAFVGTRYPQRTTDDMLGALRRLGYDDLGILDLAIAVSHANQWARMYRLLGLAPDLFYAAQVAGAVPRRIVS